MNFKDIIASDVHDAFMNAEEFSEMHTINGVEMPVQVDSNEQIEREKRFNQHMDGIYKNQKLIYVSATDYRSEEHTSELQSRGLISYAVF